MEFHAGHGCYDMEQKVGNRFLVNVALEVDTEYAAKADDISRVVNYITVYEIVEQQMAITSNIIENVASRIIDSLYRHFPQIRKVSVKVSKLAPPLGGKIEKASVTLTR